MEHKAEEERPPERSNIEEPSSYLEGGRQEDSPDYPRIHIKSFDAAVDSQNSMEPEYATSTRGDERMKETCSSESELDHQAPPPAVEKTEQHSQNVSEECSHHDSLREEGARDEMKRRGQRVRSRNASPQFPNRISSEGGGDKKVKRRKHGSSASPEAAENVTAKRLLGNPSPIRHRSIAPPTSNSAKGIETETASDIVLCACGNMIDFGPMIQCSRCKGWSHKFCTGLNDTEWEQLQVQNARYQCWICAPRSTKPSSIAADAAQALASMRTGAKWNTIMGRIIESAAMENAELVGMPPTRPRKGRMVDAVGAGSSLPRTHRSTGPRVATTEGAAPLVRDSIKENAFFEALATHWERKTGQSWQTPMFRGKLLDLYALYWGVKARGGIDAVIAAKRWPEIWRTMRNYYRESTDHSFRLRIASQQYLTDFLKQYSGPQSWDVEALKTAGEADTNPSQEEKFGAKDYGVNGTRGERPRRERIRTTQEFVKPELAVSGYNPESVAVPPAPANGPRTAASGPPATSPSSRDK
ncbi:hypothetical protein CCYA_CCYA06G1760 [Cyanidiococcus yangmingshanensis]|nr:hypothetical protein CCYA_CCYA06G1760 [Cyanidiococcus yangmingshanensis]